MSFIDKLTFWKKHDPLSDLGSNPNDVPLPPIDSQQDPLAQQPSPYPNAPDSIAAAADPLTPDPNSGMASKYDPPTDPLARDQAQNLTFKKPMSSMTPEEISQNKGAIGRDMAQKYIAQEEAREQHLQQQPPSAQQNSGNAIDMINLKVDAMKSDLALANQRLAKIEQLLEAQFKKRW